MNHGLDKPSMVTAYFSRTKPPIFVSEYAPNYCTAEKLRRDFIEHGADQVTKTYNPKMIEELTRRGNQQPNQQAAH